MIISRQAKTTAKERAESKLKALLDYTHQNDFCPLSVHTLYNRMIDLQIALLDCNGSIEVGGSTARLGTISEPMPPLMIFLSNAHHKG